MSNNLTKVFVNKLSLKAEDKTMRDIFSNSLCVLSYLIVNVFGQAQDDSSAVRLRPPDGADASQDLKLGEGKESRPKRTANHHHRTGPGHFLFKFSH